MSSFFFCLFFFFFMIVVVVVVFHSVLPFFLLFLTRRVTAQNATVVIECIYVCFKSVNVFFFFDLRFFFPMLELSNQSATYYCNYSYSCGCLFACVCVCLFFFFLQPFSSPLRVSLASESVCVHVCSSFLYITLRLIVLLLLNRNTDDDSFESTKPLNKREKGEICWIALQEKKRKKKTEISSTCSSFGHVHLYACLCFTTICLRK